MTPRVVILGILVLLVATPRPAPQTPAGFGAEITVGRTGAPQAGDTTLTTERTGASGGSYGAPQSALSAAEAPVQRESEDVRPLTPILTGTPADFTSQGSIAWASESHGPGYLAIPRGPGYLVDVCAPGGCVRLVSTDAGPDLAMQRAGRIADLAVGLWERISGVGRGYGLTVGSVTILSRPKLPETETVP